MLDLRFVRQHLPDVREMLARRGLALDLDEFVRLDAEHREVLREVEQLRATRNLVSERIADLKKRGEPVDSQVAEMREVSAKVKELEGALAEKEQALEGLLAVIPNMPHPSVPLGAGGSSNQVVRSWGEPPVFAFTPRPHWELGEALGILDLQRAAKIAGARFALYRGAGARLERGLMNFMLDLHTREHGYVEVLPPLLANRTSFYGTANLPKFEEELFKVEDSDFYLIPTAEVPVTNIHQNGLLEASALPIRYVAWTPCFRREAGSYGKDVRGLIRLHQFNKVELVKFVTPETSYEELETLTREAEAVLQRLGLAYRVVALCTGDLGFASAKTYDLEVWLPGQGDYREISSCSNFEDFQARRANIRYRPAGRGKPRFVHTLNGSGLAIGRTVVAILENYQQADGSVLIPEALRPYMDGLERLSR
ncbi:MAG: serine--tRNA ligase [Deltaproteobacteria bacterium]|nr:serine--tRNA ligase [Deltaproteobacteria bacterium]